ncbi:MAG: helix-turn-helix domain-containing protein, partial [Victivallales bacterium]|nr:helix-turn-helix domain-containing protein [Victivallales bacterium]
MKTFRNYFAVYEKEPRLSFFVRSCGYFHLVPPDQEKYRVNVDFCEIFWCISGSMRFRSCNREIQLKPGYVWYYPAGSNHVYHPCAEGCEYRWLTIAGSGAQLLFSGLDIPPGLSYAGNCPQELFTIVEANLDKHIQTRNIRMQALAAAFQILTMLSPGQHQDNVRGSMAEHARFLIDSEFSDREINVERIASMLHVHRGSLSRAFASAYDISISHYLTQCRIRHAMKLLRETATPIRDIALLSGFNSHEYFSRVFLEQ